MGFNAVLVVLTDRLDEIERDPEFGKKVSAAIRHVSCPPPGRDAPYITGQTQVISVDHSSVTQVVRVEANCGKVIGYGHWTQSDDELIKGLERERRERVKAAKLVAQS